MSYALLFGRLSLSVYLSVCLFVCLSTKNTIFYMLSVFFTENIENGIQIENGKDLV